MKRITKPGSYLLYEDILMEVTGIADGRSIHMRRVKFDKCNFCGNDGEFSVLEHSPNFQNSAKPVPTLEEPTHSTDCYCPKGECTDDHPNV